MFRKKILFLADIVMQTKVSKYINQISEMTTWSKKDISEWQDRKLVEIIRHAYENTTYYKTVFDKKGIIPSDFKSVNDLKVLPKLTKEIIKQNYFGLIAKNIKKKYFFNSSTGGSSGIPLKFAQDKNSWSFSNANYIFNWEKMGYDYGEKYIALGSSSLFPEHTLDLKHKIYYKLKNKISKTGINLSEEECLNYLDYIKNNCIKYIYGYASSIFILASYNLKLKNPIKLKICFTTSEMLTKHYRDTIINSFECAVLNCYGANDGGITAFTSNENNFKISYQSILRFTNIMDNVATGLLTDLNNYAMPFINYEVGDEFKISSSNFFSEYNGQLIDDIVGRKSDVIRLPNGEVLTGPGFTILFKDLPVKAYNLTYVKNENILFCNIHKDTNYKQTHTDLILNTIKNQIIGDTEVKLVFNQEFPLSPSGKLLYFVTK